MLHEALNQCATQGNPNNQKVYIQHKFPNHERGVQNIRDETCNKPLKESVTCHNKKKKGS